MTRATTPQWSFADLEFRAQNITLDPLLQQISDFLDQHQTLVEQVRRDLQRGLKKPATGRNGLDAPQGLRSLTLMRVKNWDYRELRERIADGYTLRQFTQFFSAPVPKHDAFHRAFVRLTPATLEVINQQVVQAAVALGLEDGKKLRTDTTVVEADIHHPTDSTLLWDTVRVISRLVGQLDTLLPRGVRGFTNHCRSVRRRMQQIQRMSAQQRQSQMVPQYRRLLRVSQRVVNNARRVLKQTQNARGKSLTDDLAIQALRKEIEHYCQLGDRVLDQTRRRVLEGEQVPSDQKIYSLFESHTDLIQRGKTQKPIEFGHKVFLAESARGLITQYRVLEGNPADEHHVESSLQHHQQTFGRPPEVYSADRGFYSPNNLATCQQAGVAVISIPQRGGKKTPERETLEKSPAFKKGQRFRAGIEGRISVLFRGRGMKRCLAEGRLRFELFVGAAVLANNLLRIAQLLRTQRKPSRPAAA